MICDSVHEMDEDGTDCVHEGLHGGISTTGSFPKGGGAHTINTHSPFSGNFRGASWNAQALFASKTRKQQRKWGRAKAFMHSHDFVCFQETHSQEGSALAFGAPEDVCIVWAHGSTRQGGVAIAMKKSFASLFNEIDVERDVEIIEGGRVLLLHLHGPYGNLDICCTYLHADSSNARRQTLMKLAKCLRSRQHTLSVLVGDFNFVMGAKDRWSGQAEEWRANGDDVDAEVIEEHILKPFHFHECDQPHFTCVAKGARARLDRVYNNQHVSMQLDHTHGATVGKWDHKLSTHRPLSFFRCRGGGDKNASVAPLQAWAFKQPDFSARVQVEYEAKLRQCELNKNPVYRLLILKGSIAYVHGNIVRSKEVVTADCVEDQLGWTLIYIRALEDRNFERAGQACDCFSSLGGCGKLASQHVMSLSEHAMSGHLHHVRELAIELAHEDINNDLRALQETTNSSGDEDIGRAKENILRKIKRLSPGESCSIGAVINNDGDISNVPEEMAKTLCDHWARVFGPSSCETPLLKSWLSQLFPQVDHEVWNTGLLDRGHSSWKILKKHVRTAIAQAKNSMPGPDGIPASAYKALGDLAIDTLFDVINVLCQEGAHDTLVEAYKSMTGSQAHDFNLSILCLLPKKASGHDEAKGNYYHPGDTRPLSISNVDNRLLASAARLAWEPILERWVSRLQRGFLKGRSMLHNTIDIDWESMVISLKHDGGALVLFDFKAAFPSISHPFLIACLKYLGLPSSAMHFIEAMYDGNKCYMRVHGRDFLGFDLKGGVRQGCPLSPLLFAVCVDILLRMIDMQLKGPMVRAFADDIAAVIHDWEGQCGVLKTIFEEFERISNLGLNVNKTVVIPLWLNGIEEVRRNIDTWAPGWGSVQVESSGTYLGFKVGPGKGSTSWDKPLCKFHDRVNKWKCMGAGMQYATVAYNVFAVSVLSYIAQLEEVPQSVLDAERRCLLRMFPGPGTWIDHEDLWYAHESFGLAKSATPIELMARAAKFRVAMMGCRFSGGRDSIRGIRRQGEDTIYSRWSLLNHAMASSDYLQRVGQWQNWYRHCYCKVLIDNVQWLRGKGISLDTVLQDIVPTSGSDERKDYEKVKRSIQSSVMRALKAVSRPNAVERMRQKTNRWRDVPFGIFGLPGHTSPAMHRRILKLSSLVNPRVHSAVFRTIWNGWCTHRRFQQRLRHTNKCVFMCAGDAEDSLEHYCRCPVTLRVARHMMHICYPAELALDIWVLSSSWLDTEEVLVAVSLLIYGCFMAFNSIRHGSVSSAEQAYQCIVQHCRQGAMGSNTCTNYLDRCWQRPMKHVC